MTTTQFHPVHNVHDGLFNAVSGRKINIVEPHPDMISIHDIAHSLSNLCRFGGHSNSFYCVAQHSVLVAALAPTELKREALLHDATEAYVGDVIKPLKVMLGDVYDDIESRFMDVIAHKFKLNHFNLLKIKEYDKQALELEHECFQKSNPFPFISAMHENGLIRNDLFTWSSTLSKNIFLTQFSRLFPEEI